MVNVPTCPLFGGSTVYVLKGGRESSAEDAVIHAIESPVGECNVFLTCSSRGELTAWDSRLADSRGPLVKYSPHPPPTPGADPGGTATTKEEEEGGYAMAVCGDRCATFSDRGRLRVYERRGPSWLPLASCDLDLRQSSSVVSQFITTGEQPIRPCVQARATTDCYCAKQSLLFLCLLVFRVVQ